MEVILTETVMAYLNLLSRHLLGGPGGNNEKSQSGYSITVLGFRAKISVGTFHDIQKFYQLSQLAA
jgi:hypothetical protein